MAHNIKGLILSIFCTFLISSNLYAFTIRIEPRQVKPGDVFLLTVEDVNNVSVKAEFNGSNIPLSLGSSNNSLALVPVDINSAKGSYPIKIIRGMDVKTTTIKVLPHSFRTIELTLPEEKVTLSPENQKRVEKEYIIQKKIWDKLTSKIWEGHFTKPTTTEISTEFGVRRIMNKKKTSIHKGVDFRGKKGTPVRAINSGTVVMSRDLFYGGNTLIINHGMGLYSVYMHLSKFNVKDQQNISRGEVIGFIGSSGRVTGPHLHMSVKLQGMSVNPEALFKLKL